GDSRAGSLLKQDRFVLTVFARAGARDQTAIGHDFHPVPETQTNPSQIGAGRYVIFALDGPVLFEKDRIHAGPQPFVAYFAEHRHAGSTRPAQITGGSARG